MKKRIYILVILVLAIAMSFTISSIPSIAKANESDISVKAKAAYLVDYDTNTVLYELNSDARLPVASMVKIMTSLLVFESIENGDLNYDEMIEISIDSASMGGSQIFLDANTKHSVENLLKSVVVASANDSCVALAERVAGSQYGFVKLMNKRASELNMKNTIFANCTGLPAPNQYSSAKDVSIMLKELLKHKKYYKLSKVWLEDYAHPDGRTTTMTNTNKLIRFYKGCDGGKTGFTSEAMFCLSASAKRGDMRVISTIVGAPSSKSRFADVSKMLNYAFGAFENKVLYDVKDPIENDVEVLKGRSSKIELVPERRVTVFTKRGVESNIDTRIEVSESIKAPIKKDEVVGKIVILKDNVVIDEINLLAKEEIKRARITDMIKRITRNW